MHLSDFSISISNTDIHKNNYTFTFIVKIGNLQSKARYCAYELNFLMFFFSNRSKARYCAYALIFLCFSNISKTRYCAYALIFLCFSNRKIDKKNYNKNNYKLYYYLL